MGPLAGIGDPVFWFTFVPILGALGASLAQAGIAGTSSVGTLSIYFLWYTQNLDFPAVPEITIWWYLERYY